MKIDEVLWRIHRSLICQVVLPLARIIRVPRYARGNISPAHAETIVVFRGRTIGVFYDWFVCPHLSWY